MRTSGLILILLFFFCGKSQAISPDSLIVKDIFIEGNRHTKERVFLREIAFKLSDTIAKTQVANFNKQSVNYLMNTGLFHEARVSDSIAGQYLYIYIYVRERWYIVPEPNFELSDRNFNAWWIDKDLRRTTLSLETTHHNFRGLNQEVTLDLSIGWRDKIGISYDIPYLNKHGTLGAAFEADYKQGHEIGLNTVDNKLVYFRFADELLLRQAGVSGSISWRPKLKSTHYLMAGFTQTSISDTVAKINPEYLGAGRKQIFVPQFSYRYVFNTRDQQFYPLKGQYLVGLIQQSGLPLLAGDIQKLTLDLTYHRFIELRKRTYMAIGLKGEHNFADYIPYLYRSALGYDELVRGYEYQVINGKSLLLMNTELKYKLLDREFRLGFIPFEQFNRIPLKIYLKGLLDAGYVHYSPVMHSNTLSNTMLIGWGAGVDFTSYYDRILRLEYSFNNTGGQGLYIHLVEVF